MLSAKVGWCTDSIKKRYEILQNYASPCNGLLIVSIFDLLFSKRIINQPMMDQKSDAKYKEILDELQVQSWQLELVISGFAIFGLFSALDPLEGFAALKQIEGSGFQYMFIDTIYITCVLTIFNLILHVLLRGLWIGAVGIR
jgi:hypothetical protein